MRERIGTAPLTPPPHPPHLALPMASLYLAPCLVSFLCLASPWSVNGLSRPWHDTSLIVPVASLSLA